MVVVARSCCQASAKQGSQGQAFLAFDVHNLWTSKMLIAHGVIVVLLLKHRVLTLKTGLGTSLAIEIMQRRLTSDSIG